MRCHINASKKQDADFSLLSYNFDEVVSVYSSMSIQYSFIFDAISWKTAIVIAESLDVQITFRVQIKPKFWEKKKWGREQNIKTGEVNSA